MFLYRYYYLHSSRHIYIYFYEIPLFSFSFTDGGSIWQSISQVWETLWVHYLFEFYKVTREEEEVWGGWGIWDALDSLPCSLALLHVVASYSKLQQAPVTPNWCWHPENSETTVCWRIFTCQLTTNLFIASISWGI